MLKRSVIEVNLYENNKFIKEEVGELQLTNYGLSGICIFNLSGRLKIGLDKGNKESIRIINSIMETGLENIINSIHNWWENVKEIFYTISDTINKLFKPIKEMIDTLKPIFINIEYQKCYFVKEYEKVPLKKYAVTELHLPMLFHCRNNC